MTETSKVVALPEPAEPAPLAPLHKRLRTMGRELDANVYSSSLNKNAIADLLHEAADAMMTAKEPELS